MYRSHKVLLQPTQKQRQKLEELLRVQCELYNAALEERKETWKREKRKVTCWEQQTQLKDLRKIRPDVRRYGVVVSRGTLSRLDRAFNEFFRRCREGQTPGYPRFKSQRRWDSVEWPSPWNVIHDNNRLYLKGIGHIKYRGSKRGVYGDVKTLTVKREGKRWYATVACKIDQPARLPAIEREIGIDLGIANLVTTSNGEHIENPRWERTAHRKLATAQRDLARKQRGSNRRKKSVTRVSACHRKVRNQRLDHAHKLSRSLIDQYDFIAHEDLQIKRMGQGRNSGLNRSIQDAGWGQLISFMTYKAEEAGREIVKVNPAYTSQRCAQCGHTARDNRTTQAKFKCVSCGHTDHADVNAACNILRAGQALREGQPERVVQEEARVMCSGYGLQ